MFFRVRGDKSWEIRVYLGYMRIAFFIEVVRIYIGGFLDEVVKGSLGGI